MVWTWVMRAGLLLAAVGAGWCLWPAQDADSGFRPAVHSPAFAALRPRVVFDEGHYNVHTSAGRYRPFAELLTRHGCRVLPSEGRITAEVLRGADVFVSVNPLGFKGAAQHAANLAGLERILRLEVDAFDQAEIESLAAWVHDGGSALIVADHAPTGTAARRLASAFGVEMMTWWAEDAEHHDQVTRNPGALVFSRDNGLLVSHPITDGRSPVERVASVVTFTGQALRPPPHGEVLLRLSPTARHYPFRNAREEEGRSIAGLAQAVAVAHGHGRVVVIGEAGALSAQLVQLVGSAPMKMGMNREDTDNRQFALNLMRWLIEAN